MDRPVFLAGFGHNRTAVGVHDPVWARCLALSDGTNTVALVGLDLVGFFYEPDVVTVRELVRQRVPRPVTVLIGSTHNHQGPDTLGMWGPTLLQTGRDEEYLTWVRERIADGVAEAVGHLEPAALTIAQDDRAELANWQSDSRLPYVKDHTLHVLQAVSQQTGQTLGALVNWANHPEALGSKNRQLSADFCDGLYRRLEELLGGVAVFWNGAIGGLISPGGAQVMDPLTGEPAPQNSFRQAELLGRGVAETAAAALRRADATKIGRGTLHVELRPLFVPLQNPAGRVGLGMGVIQRPVYTDGEADDRVTSQEVTIEGLTVEARVALGQDFRTEVGLVTLTDAHAPTPTALFLLLPGEAYPELVYGGMTRYPGADFPEAPLEPVLMEQARKTGAKFVFVVGLANDEIGYLIPQCEWDETPPWLNNAPRKPYGEINSLGWQAAGRVIGALVALLADANAWARPAISAARAAASDPPFPVRVSTNGRYLEDASGKPFLLHGDTAWSLMVQLTREETEEYLENRRQKGFNAILVNLIEYFYADSPPQNKYGDAPFTTPGDFSTPNEAYFAHADWVIRKAKEKGILVVLNPCYTGYSSNFKTSRDGWMTAILANGPAKCREYGRYVGRRYKDHANIIWQAGGDTTIPVGSELEQNWLELLRGVKEQAPAHLWTAHWYRFSTALDQVTFAQYMDLDNAYGGNRTYIQTLRAYNRANPKPTFVNEAYYEDTHLVAGAGTPPLMRAQAYWALLSGATGHFFGSDHIWAFGGPLGGPGNPRGRDWRQGMDRQPSREMVFVKRLLENRAWQDLVPDQDHSVVTSGYGTFGEDNRTPGGDYVTAARTGDGRLVMAYVPPTGTGPRTISVNMTSLGGPAEARWYNPTNGSYTDISGSPFANAGIRSFTTPGDNGTGANDWVLVLETAAWPPRRR